MMYNVKMPPLDFIKTTAAVIWSHPTWDLILVFALLAIGFFYGISTGKRRIAATLIYTYVALTIFSALPLDKLNQIAGIKEEFFLKIGAFGVIFILLAFFLRSRKSRGFAPAGAWWQIFLLSFLQVGLLIHTLLNFLPQEKIKLLAPLTKKLFANPDLHIWWIVIPIAAVIILRRFESQD